MSNSQHTMRHDRSHRGGFSMVEVVLSIVLVGLTFVVAMNLAGMSGAGRASTNQRNQARILAQQLLAEILAQDYVDSDVAESIITAIRTNGGAIVATNSEGFGPGSAEAATGNRSLFDDVDDYLGWSASPPQEKDGTVMTNLARWGRSVNVQRLVPTTLLASLTQDRGIKRITVTVTRDGVQMAQLVGIKTLGLPPTEACCMPDASCRQVPDDTCAASGGTAKGWDTNCASTDCAVIDVLFVIADPAAPTATELTRKTWMESWSFTVQLIAASAPQSEFDATVTGADVAYVCETVLSSDLGTKLTAAPIGIVNEEGQLLNEFGLASGTPFAFSTTSAVVEDNTHYITAPFATGGLTLSTSPQEFVYASGGIAPGARVLATVSSSEASLLTADIGDTLLGGTPAPGRRVSLPWGNTGFDVNALTSDAKTIMQRAIEWAAGLDSVCGDGNCDAVEQCTCANDCGAPDAFENPGVTCADGMDNDCDGAADCADANCATDPSCSVSNCGNSVCESGEDCNSCGQDCAGVTGGPPSGRYCCGNGVVESAEGDGTICDGNY